jgi:hypothetical protein
MKYWLTIMVMISLVACAAQPDKTALTSNSAAIGDSQKMNKVPEQSSAQLIKSPHGYVIKGPNGRFGGFLGDCSTAENFQYYWMCQEENAGNGGFK